MQAIYISISTVPSEQSYGSIGDSGFKISNIKLSFQHLLTKFITKLGSIKYFDNLKKKKYSVLKSDTFFVGYGFFPGAGPYPV